MKLAKIIGCFVFLFFMAARSTAGETTVSSDWTDSIQKGESKIVFLALAKKRYQKKLSTLESFRYAVVITKADGKYIWASRDNRELQYSRSGIFHVFTEKNGAGFISIQDNFLVPKSLRKKEDHMFRYGEHIRTGTGIISYYGTAKSFTP